MRLRTKLALGFGSVAALPLFALGLSAKAALSHSIDTALTARLQGAGRAASLALQAASRESEEAAAAISASAPLQQLAQSEHDGDVDLAQSARLAGSLMQARGIDVLEILDRSGVVISSGHLPGRAGDRDRRGLALAQAGGAHLARIEVERGGAIATVLATVAGGTVDAEGTPIYVLAGKRLGVGFARNLAQLTGAHVAISADGIAPARSAPMDGEAGSHTQSIAIQQNFPGDPSGAITLKISDQALRAAQSELFRSVAALGTLALLVALVLGFVFALRVTKPVDALAQGAEALARGELSHRVQVVASGELGELVATFNAMAKDLQSVTDRAVAAERVAAWREVARRLAHEIKNPLTPIRMSMETLQQAFALKRHDFPEIFEESARAIIEEVDRLKRIVGEFSRFARLPSPNLEPVDLDALLNQTLALYSGSPMRIAREGEAVPNVRADRDQLTQVLVNLLQNAEQAMPGGGRCIVRTRRLAGGEVQVDIDDSGPGIAEADRIRIFEPYFTTKPSGSGLGLAIASRIAEEHGGRIEVGSSSLGGASFRLVLRAA